MEAKNIADTLIRFIDGVVLNTLPSYTQLEPEHKDIIRLLVDKAFKDGYEDCLSDVREGLIK